MHPDVAAVLQQAERLQSLMDEQLHKMNNQTFTATDDAETVVVTLNGHHHLTGTFIADGLLRLGAEEQASAGQLRCALGAAVARACDLVSDKTAGGDLPGRFAEARSWRP